MHLTKFVMKSLLCSSSWGMRSRLWLLGGLLGGLLGPLLVGMAEKAVAQSEPSAQGERLQPLLPVRPDYACSNDLDTLIPLLLRDLPSYANRVSARAADLDNRGTSPGYVLLTSQATDEPLTLGPGGYYPATDDDASLKQIFFTTLERQYVSNSSVEMQNFHWLFLTQTSRGWRVAMMFSRLADYPDAEPISPPHDSSYGAIAQAVRLWLRDCYAGAVYPPS